MSYPILPESERVDAHTGICCATDSIAHLSLKGRRCSILPRFLKNIETFLLFWPHLLVIHSVISFMHELYG